MGLTKPVFQTLFVKVKGKFLILFGTIEGPTVTIKCNKYFGAHLIIQILHIFT